jgi:hypothetical protein
MMWRSKLQRHYARTFNRCDQGILGAFQSRTSGPWTLRCSQLWAKGVQEHRFVSKYTHRLKSGPLELSSHSHGQRHGRKFVTAPLYRSVLSSREPAAF